MISVALTQGMSPDERRALEANMKALKGVLDAVVRQLDKRLDSTVDQLLLPPKNVQNYEAQQTYDRGKLAAYKEIKRLLIGDED